MERQQYVKFAHGHGCHSIHPVPVQYCAERQVWLLRAAVERYAAQSAKLRDRAYTLHKTEDTSLDDEVSELPPIVCASPTDGLLVACPSCGTCFEL